MTDQEVKPAIEARELTKRYGEVIAVDRASFAVRPDEVFGFLGPNGAGKTTTITMLTGLARPTTGSVSFFGAECGGDMTPAKRLMGVVPDESNLYPELSGFENLAFAGALYGMRRREREERARDLLAEFGLADVGERKFGAYSKGMKRKLTIAAGIVHRPRILFLDEPTTGIDVASARQIRQLLARLNADGTTIFLTTHYIEEAERLCHRIAFVVRGRIVALDTVENLMRGCEDRHTVEFAIERPTAGLVAAFGDAFPDVACEPAGDRAIRLHAGAPIGLAPFVRFFEEHGVAVTEARRIRPSLEDVFVRVIGIESTVMRNGKGGPA